MRKLIRVDGTVTDLPGKLTIDQAHELIGCDTGDSFMLKDDVHVMIVDDTGAYTKPVNQKATEHYWEKCGRPVDAYIHGDVVIVPDSDYGPTYD